MKCWMILFALERLDKEINHNTQPPIYKMPKYASNVPET